MKLGNVVTAIAILCLGACSQAPSSPTSGSPVLAGGPGTDGTYVAQMISGNCGNAAPQIVVKGGIASFTSGLSGAHAEAPINPDGSYSLVTPSVGRYGITTVHVNADGSGTFEVRNQYRPCFAGLALRRN